VRRDAELLRVLDAGWAEASRRAGRRLVCRPGCAECCLGPFPINILDAHRLREGLSALERDDSGRAALVEARAREHVSLLSASFPGDAESGRLASEEEARERFFASERSRPCPALDPESRTCDLYVWRPVSCRTFGPPTRIGEEDLPPCSLCFVGASPEEIERCRVAPDEEGVEEGILDALGDDGHETIVAWALVRSRSRR